MDVDTSPAAPPSTPPSIADDLTVAWYAAVVAHLNKFPHLNGTVTNVLGYQADITVRRHGSSKLAVFSEWIRSMANVTLVKIAHVYEEDGNFLLVAHGDLVDGTRTAVTVIVKVDEADLLAANTTVDKGATFPTELLLRLVDHDAAEAVSRG